MRCKVAALAIRVVIGGVAMTLSAPAAADVTSWLAFGGGYGLEHSSVEAATTSAGTFSALLGVGSSPRAAVVGGFVFRSVTHFSLGTDLSLAPRIATGGFARGDWGAAIDLGVGARWWRGGDYGTYPLVGVLTLGCPWGVEIAVGADAFDLAGTRHTEGGYALLELDLLRLTVMRQGSTDSIWRNPSPAGGREAGGREDRP